MKNLSTRSNNLDIAILSTFIIWITWQPFFLYGEINLFEVGLYLPGIETILKGGQLFRDIFHLRGPIEIYIPALLMKIFATNLTILSIYFYIGTLLTLLICLLIAKELLQTRLFLYLFSLVLAAKTFPRVVFTYWGGFRFAIGLLSIYCILKFYQSKYRGWFYGAALAVSISILTSLEIGFAAGLAIALTLLLIAKKELPKFIGWTFIFTLPFLIYLKINHALIPMIDSNIGVLLGMAKTFPQVESAPANLWQVLTALINPVNKNFRHLTPLYAYLFFTLLFFKKFKQKELEQKDLAATPVAIYGFILFITSFRNIWSSNFEMMLQPEKIILFIIVERMFFLGKKYIAEKKSVNFQTFLVRFALLGILISSIAFPLTRFNRRFYSYQYGKYLLQQKDVQTLKPFSDENSKEMQLPRIKGMRLPLTQAEDLEQLHHIVNHYTTSKDPVLFFPEYGALNFILNRPFVGRFPTATLSWFNDQWHRDFLTALQSHKPKLVVLPKEFPAYFEKTQLQVKSNQLKYHEVREWIEQNYIAITQTPTFKVLQLKEAL